MCFVIAVSHLSTSAAFYPVPRVYTSHFAMTNCKENQFISRMNEYCNLCILKNNVNADEIKCIASSVNGLFCYFCFTGNKSGAF